MCFYSVLISRHSWLYWLQNYLSCIELESLVSISWIMRWIKPEFGRDIAWYNSNEHHATSHYQKKRTKDPSRPHTHIHTHTHTHRHTDAHKKTKHTRKRTYTPQRKETDVFLYTYTIDWLKLYSWKKKRTIITIAHILQPLCCVESTAHCDSLKKRLQDHMAFQINGVTQLGLVFLRNDITVLFSPVWVLNRRSFTLQKWLTSLLCIWCYQFEWDDPSLLLLA